MAKSRHHEAEASSGPTKQKKDESGADRTDTGLAKQQDPGGRAGKRHKREKKERQKAEGVAERDDGSGKASPRKGQEEEKEKGSKFKKRKSTFDASTEEDPGLPKRRKPSPPPALVDQSVGTETDAGNDQLSKHPSILKKFQALLRAKSTAVPTEKPTIPKEELPAELRPQGLHPLPQPVSTKRSKAHLPLDAALPSWLSSPTIVPSDHTIPFAELPLSEKLKSRITTHLKFETAFAVQAAILPLLLKSISQPNVSSYHDVLVSAPTGSGKTLSYILPIVHDLSSRIVTRIRAVIIVPTRELVSQVRDTAESLASGLKIGIAWGARSIDFERTLLVRDNWEDDGRPDGFDHQQASGGEGGGERYSSKVDILICTPGRLVEHLTTTPGFHFRNLKWMVIDEADRLLAQSFQEWLDAVIKGLQQLDSTDSYRSTTGAFSGALGIRKDYGQIVRKVILSATMTKDAEKLAGLKLRKPKLVVVEEQPIVHSTNLRDADEDIPDTPVLNQQNGDDNQEDISVNNSRDGYDDDDDEDGGDFPDEIFSVPSTLVEHYIPIPQTEDKPLYLLNLLQTKNISSCALIFTKSNESAARLARLMELMLDGNASITTPTASPIKFGLVSGELNKSGRKKTLAEFKRKEIDMYVAFPPSPLLSPPQSSPLSNITQPHLFGSLFPRSRHPRRHPHPHHQLRHPHLHALVRAPRRPYSSSRERRPCVVTCRDEGGEVVLEESGKGD